MKTNTYYLIFLSTLALPLPARPQAAPLVDEAALDTLVHDIATLQEQAYDIQEALLLVPEKTMPYQKHLTSLIHKLTEEKVHEAQLEPIKNALSRYQVLADACIKAHRDPKKLALVLTLLAQRARLVEAIALPTYTCMQANTFIYNAQKHIGRPLTPAERQALAAERNILASAKNKQLEVLQQELFEIEKELYRDRRSWLKKNGKALIATALTIGAGICTMILMNKVHDWHEKRKSNKK